MWDHKQTKDDHVGKIAAKDDNFSLDLVVAYDKHQAIGYRGKLPWNIPEDLSHFKELTTGHVVIMGRKTFESIGRTLPDRINIVVSQSMWQSMYRHRSQDKREKETNKTIDPKKNTSEKEKDKDNQNRKIPGTVVKGNEALIIRCLEDLQELLRNEVFLGKKHFIIGGRSLYKWSIPFVHTMYITEIEGVYPADTYFPAFDQSLFTRTVTRKKEGNPPFAYVKYTRKENERNKKDRS